MIIKAVISAAIWLGREVLLSTVFVGLMALLSAVRNRLGIRNLILRTMGTG